MEDGKVLVGDAFRKAVVRWYRSLALDGPTLDQIDFP